MASAECEPIMGVWGQSPQQDPGAEPLVRGQGAKPPPEAESFLRTGHPKEGANWWSDCHDIWSHFLFGTSQKTASYM